MKVYQNLIREIRAEGTWSENRTAVPTTRLDGAMMRFDLSKGFPAVTSKKLAFKSVVGELCAFLRASRSAADFRALGCKVWDANANDPGTPEKPNAWLMNAFRQGEDDIGPVYGVQWREWPAFKFFTDYTESLGEIKQAEAMGWEILMRDTIVAGVCPENVVMYKEIDQLGECIRQIIQAPTGRRILFHGWNPAVLDQVALPACHLLYQFLPDPVNGKLNMTCYLRSWDFILGAPYNIAESAALLSLVARLTGYQPGRLTMFGGDVHIYDNQNAYADEILTKEPLPLPTLVLNDRIPSYDPADNAGFMDDSGNTQIDHLIEWLALVEPEDFMLVNYEYHTLETPVPAMVV